MINPLAEYVLNGLKAREASPEAIAARSDPDLFIEYCFKDDDGSPIVQAPHHSHLQKIITEQRRAVVLYPVGFGKTTQIVMRIIWELGTDPSIRIVVISSKGAQSQKIVQAVAREMVSNERIKEVFPDLKPAIGTMRKSADTWRGTALRVEGAPANQKDPSLASYGLDGAISGTRAELIFGDNLMDFENTYSGTMRAKNIDRFAKEAMGRLIPGRGRVLITDTAWTKDDLPHEFMKRDGWFSQVFSAEENPFGDGVLWPARFPREELDKIKGDILQLAYDLTYRNIPLSESMQYFKEEFWDLSYGRVPWMDSLRGEPAGFNLQCDLRTGVDLATRIGEEHDLSSFCTVIAAGHRRRIINLNAERMQITAILRKMASIYRQFHRPVNLAGGNARFVVEDNAAQVYVVDLLKDAAMLSAIGLTKDEASDIRVVGRTTTANKRDRQLGIPAIASGLEMGRYDIAAHQQTTALREDMRIWYPGLPHYGDRLMSLWLATADMINTVGGSKVDFI